MNPYYNAGYNPGLNYSNSDAFSYPVTPSAPDFEDNMQMAPSQPMPVYPNYYQQLTPVDARYYQSLVVPIIPPKPVVTQHVHHETEKLLAKAAEVSSSILYQPTPKFPSSTPSGQAKVVQPVITPLAPINIDLSDRRWEMFNNKTEVHHHHHNGGGKDVEKKEDTGTRLLVGAIGLTVALVTAYFAGKAIAQGEDEAEENVGFEKLKDCWNFNKVCYEDDYQSNVEDIVSRTDAILQRKQTSRTQNIALLIFAFIAGGVGFAGALMSSPALMTTAVALGALVGVATLFKLGYSCFSTRNVKDAQEIHYRFVELHQQQPIIVG